MSYLKGKDGKIKGIENLEGLPDTIIYRTSKADWMEWSIDEGGNVKCFIHWKPAKAPEGFEGW